MPIRSLLDSDKRAAYFGNYWKRLRHALSGPAASRPVFLFGKQRSGTSMLMYAFHRHPGMLVFDEHRHNAAFENYRIRSHAAIRALVETSPLKAVCFKPICDSHLIADFAAAFPDARHLWIYRHYRDVSNSSLRKFNAPTRAIRLICNDQPGGGWLQEGASAASRAVLQDVYHPGLSEFDLGCLVWWLRNRIIIESGLLGRADVSLIRYESLVAEPERHLRWLCERIGVPYVGGMSRNIRAEFVGRHPAPAMDEAVRELCDDLLARLNAAFAAGGPAAPEAVAAMPGAA